jgi:drug/metabolite transporter (DMT)-like permease
MSTTSLAHLWPGVPLALGSAVLFGLSAPASKALLAVVDPQMLAGLLYLGAGLGLLVVHRTRALLGLDPPEAPLGRRDLPTLAAVVLFGGVAGPLLLMLGLARTNASTGSLLLNLEGITTMVLAWVVFRENVDRRLVLGAAAILLGAAILGRRDGDTAFGPGALLIAGACLAWGIDNNLTRLLSASDAVLIALIKGLAAGAINLTAALLRGGALPDAATAAGAAVVGFFGIGLSLVLFVRALRHLGTARTGAYFSLAPFIGAIAALALPGEAPTLWLAIAGLLMAIGLWLHLTESHHHDHAHEAAEHDHPHVHDEHHRHSHDGDMVEPHTHRHRHEGLRHAHVHYPDLHHGHSH